MEPRTPSRRRRTCAQTVTTITGADVAVTLTALENGVSGTQAFLDFSFMSDAAATAAMGNINQSFMGTFSINSLANGLGTNYLSGNFNDLATGSAGGNQLTVGAGTPSDVVNFAVGRNHQPGLGPLAEHRVYKRGAGLGHLRHHTVWIRRVGGRQLLRQYRSNGSGAGQPAAVRHGAGRSCGTSSLPGPSVSRSQDLVRHQRPGRVTLPGRLSCTLHASSRR